MIKRIDNVANFSREWTLNDRVNGNVFGRVKKSESPLLLRLSWKPDDIPSKQLVGVYELNLPELIKAGYIRDYKNRAGEVFLRFQRDNKRIQIAINRKSQAIDIGTIE
jgi:hypothetical protein